MSAASADRVLWRAALGDDAELRVTTSVFRGSRYVSLRNYWRNPEGEWCPTRKGVTVNIELLDEIIEALTQVRDAQGGEAA